MTLPLLVFRAGALYDLLSIVFYNQISNSFREVAGDPTFLTIFICSYEKICPTFMTNAFAEKLARQPHVKACSCVHDSSHKLPCASVSKRVYLRNDSYENVFHLHVYFHANQNHVHFNGFARRLALKLRQRATRKWPISHIIIQKSPVVMHVSNVQSHFWRVWKRVFNKTFVTSCRPANILVTEFGRRVENRRWSGVLRLTAV